MAELYSVKGNVRNNRVALHERHPDHPGGEIYIVGTNTAQVGFTLAVRMAIARGSLVLLGPGDDAKLGTNETKLGTNEAKPGTDDAKPGTNETKPGTDDAKPGTDDAKPGTNEAKPGTDDAKPGTNEAKLGTAQSALDTTPPSALEQERVDFSGAPGIGDRTNDLLHEMGIHSRSDLNLFVAEHGPDPILELPGMNQKRVESLIAWATGHDSE